MRKIFGPYRGSKQNGGRPIYVFKRKKKNGEVVTTSSNKARVDYEKATGKTLPKSTEVDHKNNKGRAGDDRISNLRTLSKSKNVGLENKRRAKKTVAKKAAPKKAAKKK
jgi:mRNA-degrading endonuclease toxin of MazEF toxin-antitoxin module